MKRIRTLLLAVALTTSITSCAAVVSYLPTVVSVVTDALIVVDQIKTFVDGVHAVKPDVDLAKVYAAISRTKVALDAALRATNGVDKLTKEQADAAFADFRVAYQDLIALVGPLGVTTGNGLKAAPGSLQVPTPMALGAVAMARPAAAPDAGAISFRMALPFESFDTTLRFRTDTNGTLPLTCSLGEHDVSPFAPGRACATNDYTFDDDHARELLAGADLILAGVCPGCCCENDGVLPDRSTIPAFEI